MSEYYYYIPSFNNNQLIYSDEQKLSRFKSFYNQEKQIHYDDIVIGNSYIIFYDKKFQKATFKGSWLYGGFHKYKFDIESSGEKIEIKATEKDLMSVMSSKVYVNLFTESGNISTNLLLFRKIDTSSMGFELYIKPNGSIDAVR